MKVQKIVSVDGEFAKAGIDIKDGDKITINNAGISRASRFDESKEEKMFKIETRNGEKVLTFNQKSLNNLIDAFGDDTDNWVSKQVNATVLKVMVSSKLANVTYLFADGWAMDDKGNFYKGESKGTEPSVQLDDIEDEPPF